MKLATIRTQGGATAAIIDADAGRAWPIAGQTMLDIIASGSLPSAQGDGIAFDESALLAPIPEPARTIFCVGKNYREHVAEMNTTFGEVPEYPVVFPKLAACVTGPGDPIPLPTGVSDQIDYEAEIAVIIGRGGKGIAKADAMAHVFGYTILNDVTARDLQRRHMQWLIGKSLDGFCPMGPWIVTADEIAPETMTIRLTVNGERRQSAIGADMIFDIPTLIESISAGITLRPGDIIATGTPAGVGAGFKPPKFLKAGDVVEIEIGGIGKLRNPVA
jgi:2-keto-4-pentenoate hydratase/2-oxohepta-3-ene-1,7-dioic acid hydratase in catechol pathway